MKQWKFEQGPWKAVAEDMSDFHIWCFTCTKEVDGKNLLKTHHLNHEVDWMRNTDGMRYAFLPDGSVPCR